MTLTDGQLVERVRNGDRDEFGDLVGRYRDMVYGLGYHLSLPRNHPCSPTCKLDWFCDQ